MSLIFKVKSVEALFDAMKRYIVGEGSQITNFNVGGRIRQIFESIATTLHQSQFDFSQAAKIAIPLAVFNGFEFDRLGGIKSAGKLEFARTTPAIAIIDIPIGTAINLDGIIFETMIAGTIEIGFTTSGQIDSQAAIEGISGNINANAINTLGGQGIFVNQPVGAESASNPVTFSGGLDLESDEDRLKRFREFINSLARSTVKGIEAGARSVNGVVSATAVENVPQPGFITLYVDDGSGNLPAPLQAEVEKVINGDPNDSFNFPGYRGAGIKVIVTNPTVVQINVTANIKILNTSLSDDIELENLSQTAIERSINTLTLGFDVIISELISETKKITEDIFDVQILIPVANVTVADGQVARTNIVTVTSERIDP